MKVNFYTGTLLLRSQLISKRYTFIAGWICTAYLSFKRINDLNLLFETFTLCKKTCTNKIFELLFITMLKLKHKETSYLRQYILLWFIFWICIIDLSIISV